MFGWLPGADLNSVVQREIKDLNDTRTGSASRTGAWNWQDDIGAWMAGSNKEEVLRLAQEAANDELRKKLQPRATLAQSNLGGLKSTYTGVEGKTKEQLEAEILQDEQRGKALQTTIATNPRFDAGTLSPNATAGQILGAGTKATTEYQDGEKKKADEKEESRYRDTKDLTIMQLLNSQEDRRAERELRRDQQAYQNRALDLKEARLDRRDRQAAIQQMMAGLAQMGASIAI